MASFRHNPGFDKEFEPQLRIFLGRAASQVETDAKTRAPWKTGNLRRSISWSMEDGPVAIVWASAHYAKFVELGTRYMNPQPFLRPALAAVIGRLRRG